jgi:hypothetical protein
MGLLGKQRKKRVEANADKARVVDIETESAIVIGSSAEALRNETKENRHLDERDDLTECHGGLTASELGAFTVRLETERGGEIAVGYTRSPLGFHEVLGTAFPCVGAKRRLQAERLRHLAAAQRAWESLCARLRR